LFDKKKLANKNIKVVIKIGKKYDRDNSGITKAIL
jgi:hypothetical protein